MMRRKDRLSAPAFGGSALLVIFGVLALTVFALLTLSTALADRRLSDAAAEAAAAYYEADLEAERIFARLRSGELPETVVKKEERYSYCCPVSRHQTLQVELEKGDAGWEVLRWQILAQPEEEDRFLPVWDGK